MQIVAINSSLLQVWTIIYLEKNNSCLNKELFFRGNIVNAGHSCRSNWQHCQAIGHNSKPGDRVWLNIGHCVENTTINNSTLENSIIHSLCLLKIPRLAFFFSNIYPYTSKLIALEFFLLVFPQNKYNKFVDWIKIHLID